MHPAARSDLRGRGEPPDAERRPCRSDHLGIYQRGPRWALSRRSGWRIADLGQSEGRCGQQAAHNPRTLCDRLRIPRPCYLPPVWGAAMLSGAPAPMLLGRIPPRPVVITAAASSSPARSGAARRIATAPGLPVPAGDRSNIICSPPVYKLPMRQTGKQPKQRQTVARDRRDRYIYPHPPLGCR